MVKNPEDSLIKSIEVHAHECMPEKILKEENKEQIEKYKDPKGEFVKPSDHAPLVAVFDWKK